MVSLKELMKNLSVSCTSPHLTIHFCHILPLFASNERRKWMHRRWESPRFPKFPFSTSECFQFINFEPWQIHQLVLVFIVNHYLLSIKLCFDRGVNYIFVQVVLTKTVTIEPCVNYRYVVIFQILLYINLFNILKYFPNFEIHIFCQNFNKILKILILQDCRWVGGVGQGDRVIQLLLIVIQT